MNKKGISTIAVVVILVVAVVVVAGAYVLLKNNDDGDNSADDTVIESKMGVGSVLYYDSVSSIGAITTTAATTDITGELVGENGSHYFFEYGQGSNKYLILEIQKETGAVSLGTESDGVWTVTFTDENYTTEATIVIGPVGDYGQLVSKISIKVNGSTVVTAEVRSSWDDILEPSEYESSGYVGKYQKYDVNMLITMSGEIIGESIRVEMTGYTKVSIEGNAADNKLLVLVEGYLKMTSNWDYFPEVEYSISQYQIVEDLQDEIPEIPEELPDLIDEGTTNITVGGKSVEVREYTFDMDYLYFPVDGKIYTSIDGSILYLFEMSGTISEEGVSGSFTMTIKYAEGNL